MIDLSSARRLLGVSTALWAGADGVGFDHRGWTALSRARSVDYNVVFSAGDGDDLEAGVERIREAGVPAVLMVAGPALGDVQRLVSMSWVCIGQTPLMALDLQRFAGPEDGGPESRELRSDAEISSARALVADVFGVGAELAAIAIPDGIASRAGQSLWGAYDGSGVLCSCLALVRCEHAVVVWSMASSRSAQGRGYGRAALRAALSAAANAGASTSLLYASPAGERFYARIGYRDLERWQIWSRPRWVLGRA